MKICEGSQSEKRLNGVILVRINGFSRLMKKNRGDSLDAHDKKGVGMILWNKVVD